MKYFNEGTSNNEYLEFLIRFINGHKIKDYEVIARLTESIKSQADFEGIPMKRFYERKNMPKHSHRNREIRLLKSYKKLHEKIVKYYEDMLKEMGVTNAH